MALKPVSSTPPLPYPSGRGVSLQSLASFDADLVKALHRYLADMAVRLNQAAMTEEGTFTPELAFGGSSVGITYASRSGSFKRTGKLVFVTGSISLTSKGAAAGSATIGGLPDGETAVGSISNYVFTGITTTPTITISGTSGALRYTSGAADTPMLDTHFTNTSSFTFTATYEMTE